MAVDSIRGNSGGPGKGGRILAAFLGFVLGLSLMGAVAYLSWPRGATPVGLSTYVAGVVQLDSGAPAVGATVTVRSEDGTAFVRGHTGPDGRYNLGFNPTFPTRLVAEVTYHGPVGPSATGFRWSPLLERGGAIDLGRTDLPDATTKALDLAGATARNDDGTISVSEVPANVGSLWAGLYDPDASPEVFPGDLAEGRDLPLNSFGFLWISALDAGGSPIVDLDAPATIRIAVPETQWVDIEDLQPGNGVIDIPIYSFDYGTAYWVREANGRVTDPAGTGISEGEEQAIRLGTYAGPVYAEFQAGHFSWWNLDKTPTDCSLDFGDAPDPTYPSLLASGGARHENICRAWLGRWADAEDDARVPDKDLYDDAVVSRDPLKIAVSNWDWAGDLFLNALIDRNNDGDWADAGEWAIQNLLVFVPAGKGGVVDTDIPWNGQTWMRLTLTGERIENYVGKGSFAIGETEDYSYFMDRLSIFASGNGTVSSDPAGIDCHRNAGACSADYRTGSTVTLTATPDPGESFVGWGADCSGFGVNPTCTLTMDHGHFVGASFTAPSWYLTVYIFGSPSNQTYGMGNVTSEPPGISCDGGRDGTGGGGNCTVAFPPGTVVTLTATPDAGFTFVGWGGDCTGSSPTCTLTMDRDRWVIAYFARA